MKPNPPPPDAPGGVDQTTLDLFSSEGAPSPVDLHFESIASPAPRECGTPRYRMPLWRLFNQPE
jgi:hypothetical protein